MIKKYIVWGIGERAKKLISLDNLEKIEYFVDEKRQGEMFAGKIVKSPECLKDEDKDNICVMVSSVRYYTEIRDMLLSWDYVENVNFFNAWNLTEKYILNEINPQDRNGEVLGDWGELEYRPDWELRADSMSKMIPNDVKSLLEIGCGKGTLVNHIRNDIEYHGSDINPQIEGAIKLDLNRDELPEIKVDMYYLAGVIYYMDDLKETIKKLCNGTKYILLDYNGRELSNTWGEVIVGGLKKNYVKTSDVINTFRENGYILNKIEFDTRAMPAAYMLFEIDASCEFC